MSNVKRLFLFAGYSSDNRIDNTLVFYVKKLSHHGDVILCMDSNCPGSELNKVHDYTIAGIGVRHGEYDFGSYKRCFQYARDNKILDKYDFVYLVNDSVFGPLFNITNILKRLESVSSDACGLVESVHKTHSFMESWFVCVNKKIATSVWFNEFMSNITIQKSKSSITVQYEHGLSNLIKNNNCSWTGLYRVHGRTTYNKPKKLFKIGCPFIKKACFTRHGGALGGQIKYILSHSDKILVNAIMQYANRVYGTKYTSWLLTNNPYKIIIRKIKYGIQKIINGGI